VSADNIRLTDSDKFVADWIVSHIEALPDDIHEKLTERISIREERA
jgi:hypothetical protein